MAIQNPRFEALGQFPGEAESWTLKTQASLREFAGFGDEPAAAWERYDRCCECFGALEAVGFVIAFFDNRPESYDDFNENWLNDLYLRQLQSGHVETLGIERMELLAYELRLENNFAVSADFGDEKLEIFVPIKYIADLERIETEWALFDNSSEFEIFEE